VCKALEISNGRDAVSRLDSDEKSSVALTDGTPGNPNMTIINEPGLYSLVLGSRKPEAKAFKRWITHEVIPSVRKTGANFNPLKNEQVRIEDKQGFQPGQK
jgi:Prophage antirepressor